MTEKEFYIWLAGFIDGEGCIYLCKSKSKNRSGFQITLRLEIAQSDKKLLDYIKNKIGFGSNIWNKSQEKQWLNTKYKSKRGYAFKLASNQALNILRKIYPYLIIKKEQARLAIEFQKKFQGKARVKGQGNKSGYKPKEYWEKQLEYMRKIKELKKKEFIAP